MAAQKYLFSSFKFMTVLFSTWVLREIEAEPFETPRTNPVDPHLEFKDFLQIFQYSPVFLHVHFPTSGEENNEGENFATKMQTLGFPTILYTHHGKSWATHHQNRQQEQQKQQENQEQLKQQQQPAFEKSPFWSKFSLGNKVHFLVEDQGRQEYKKYQNLNILSDFIQWRGINFDRFNDLIISLHFHPLDPTPVKEPARHLLSRLCEAPVSLLQISLNTNQNKTTRINSSFIIKFTMVSKRGKKNFEYSVKAFPISIELEILKEWIDSHVIPKSFNVLQEFVQFISKKRRKYPGGDLVRSLSPIEILNTKLNPRLIRQLGRWEVLQIKIVEEIVGNLNLSIKIQPLFVMKTFMPRDRLGRSCGLIHLNTFCPFLNKIPGCIHSEKVEDRKYNIYYDTKEMQIENPMRSLIDPFFLKVWALTTATLIFCTLLYHAHFRLYSQKTKFSVLGPLAHVLSPLISQVPEMRSRWWFHSFWVALSFCLTQAYLGELKSTQLVGRVGVSPSSLENMIKRGYKFKSAYGSDSLQHHLENIHNQTVKDEGRSNQSKDYVALILKHWMTSAPPPKAQIQGKKRKKEKIKVAQVFESPDKQAVKVLVPLTSNGSSIEILENFNVYASPIHIEFSSPNVDLLLENFKRIQAMGIFGFWDAMREELRWVVLKKFRVPGQDLWPLFNKEREDEQEGSLLPTFYNSVNESAFLILFIFAAVAILVFILEIFVFNIRQTKVQPIWLP